jgi:hypothetical protein
MGRRRLTLGIRPDGVEQHLRSAELHARGLENFGHNTPSLLTSVFLFDWETGRQVCPPPPLSMASAFAAVEPPHDSHRFSADWTTDNEGAPPPSGRKTNVSPITMRVRRANKNSARMLRRVNDSWRSSSGY